MKQFSMKPRHLVSAALLSLLALPACGSGGDDGDDGTGGLGGATGGSATTGGASTGGGATTGGAGTGGGTASVCDGATSAPIAAQVSDLENEMTTGWDVYVSTPGDGGTSVPTDLDTYPTSDELIEEVAANEVNTTSFAAHYEGTGWITYGAGMNFNLEGCKDLSAYTGVRFLAKGSTTRPDDQEVPPTTTDNFLNFRVITAGAHGQIIDGGVNVGGDCVVESGKCFQPPQKNITLTEEWQEYEVLFTELVTPAGAAPGSAFTGTNAMLLGWHSENGDFSFSIDEVEFF